MSVIPSPPPLASFKPVNAVDSWPVRQRGSPPAAGACGPGAAGAAATPAAAGPNAAAAATPAAALAAGGPAAALPPGGLLAAQAATTRAEHAPASAAARPRASGPPRRTEVFTVYPPWSCAVLTSAPHLVTPSPPGTAGGKGSPPHLGRPPQGSIPAATTNAGQGRGLPASAASAVIQF